MDLYDQAAKSAGDPAGALALAQEFVRELPRPASGRTEELWDALVRLGGIDLTVARALEPHLDAVSILDEAGIEPAPGTYGVFAAEGPGMRLSARETGDTIQLNGTKPWCSLAGQLDRALITAWVDDERRGLFEVDLKAPGVRVRSGEWVARGLSAVDSSPVEFEAVPARPVGGPGWYLRRPGFAWGGVGVAAIWLGAALALFDTLKAAGNRRPPDQIALMHLGRCDVVTHTALATLRAAAQAVDDGRVDDPGLLAGRVRAACAMTAETVLAVSDHALGPAPLTQDETHAARVADLHLYLRQWHAERDLAAIGAIVQPR
ncbi:acyl-CoA dehydrogenase [Calidifontibacter terrae]